MNFPVPVFNYSISNKAENEVDIHIDGDIVDASTQAIFKDWFGDDTTTSFKSFRDQLNSVEANVFNVYINSGGGIVTDAMAIHDLLKDIQTKGKTVNTIGRGIVASAATYILMAGGNPRMSKNSWFMIHNVSGGVWGDVNLVESYASTLRKFNNRSRDFYSEFTGMRKEDITKMMDAETWMNADEAKQKGFIKEIDGEAEFTNTISREKWQYGNLSVLNAYNSAVKQPPIKDENDLLKQNHEEMKKFLQDLGTNIMNAIKGIKPAENNDHETLMNSIAEAVGKPFSEAADQMEAAVVEIVNKRVTPETTQTQIDSAVKVAVDAATKDFNQKITDLETTNAELKTINEELGKDILQMKGKKSSGNSEQKDAPKVIGAYTD